MAPRDCLEFASSARTPRPSPNACSRRKAAGHRPPAGLHGLGGLFGSGKDDTEQAHGSFLNRPSSFVAKQDGDRIELSDSAGRVRVLTANGPQEKVNGRDVRTKWDKGLLVSETALGRATITETYERSPDATRLIVTTQIEMDGRNASVHRVYDAENAR